MNIIKLHSTLGGLEIYINIERIDSFFRGDKSTVIYIGGSDEEYHITETPEDIIKLIKESDNNAKLD